MEPETTPINESTAKKEIKRSTSYPAITVMEAYLFASRVNEQFSNADVSRDEIAHAFKLNPSTISRDIAACVQYGLMIKNTTEGKYKLSERFMNIFRPENEKDKKLNLIAAFGSPKLYQDLINKFDNNVVPIELANTLIKHHGITVAASKGAAETFINSAKEVEVINDNRLLKYNTTASTISKTQYAIIEDIGVDHDREQERERERERENDQGLPAIFNKEFTSNKENKEHIHIPIHLTNDRVAVFAYPKRISENDVKIVEHQLAGILLRIKLENEEKKIATMQLMKLIKKIKGTNPLHNLVFACELYSQPTLEA